MIGVRFVRYWMLTASCLIVSLFAGALKGWDKPLDSKVFIYVCCATFFLPALCIVEHVSREPGSNFRASLAAKIVLLGSHYVLLVLLAGRLAILVLLLSVVITVLPLLYALRSGR